jgi:predicted O-methyltransferase YrrM
MPLDLAVIVPTRGRPENIRKVISAWDFTNAWDAAHLVLAVDADDLHLFEYQEPGISDHTTLKIMDTWMPMVNKLNAAAVMLAEGRKYFALGFAGDDHLPRTIGWAQRYLTVLREMGTGMVYGDDGYQGSKLSTEWAVTSDVVRTLGRMVPASVEHMYCDNAMLDLFTASGCVQYLPEVQIEHMHPIAGKSENDDQYRKVNSRDQFHRDRAAYQRWQRTDMGDDVIAVRALRLGKPSVPPSRTRAPRKAVKPVSLVPKIFKRVRGATPDEIGVTLADFARSVPGYQAIVELGVFQGRTALLMAWGARQGGGAHVWGIDAWEMQNNTYGEPFKSVGSRNWARYNINAVGYANDVTLVHGFSLDAAMQWEGPKVGLLFIDADHSYEGCRADVLAWAPHLAEGAIIAVDDYGHPDWPGVQEAIDALVSEGVLDPIEIFHGALAVTRLVEKTPETTAITSEGVSPAPVVGGSALVSTTRTVASTGTATATATGVPVVVSERTSLPVANAEVVQLPPPAGSPVQEGELDDGLVGTEINDLGIHQLRELASARRIVLGRDRRTRDAVLSALLSGE